jgi:hypothetical protein
MLLRPGKRSARARGPGRVQMIAIRRYTEHFGLYWTIYFFFFSLSLSLLLLLLQIVSYSQLRSSYVTQPSSKTNPTDLIFSGIFVAAPFQK